MADGSPAKATWSDAEKFELVANILETYNWSVKWSEVQLPAGRTQKACMHVITKIRTDAKARHEAAGDTPKKIERSTKKTGSSHKKHSNVSNQDEVETPTKKRKVESKSVKEEKEEGESE